MVRISSSEESKRREAASAVDDILDKVPLIDCHNDTPLVIKYDPIAGGKVRAFQFETKRAGDTDIPRLKDGKIGAQVWAAFTNSSHPRPATETLELIDIVHQMQELHAAVFKPVLRSDDIIAAQREKKIGSILAVEGGVGLENTLAPLRIWHRLGVRLMTLCHNSSLDWIDSSTDEPKSGGLSEFGRSVIGELNRLGIIVDCSHTSTQATRQALEFSAAPIVISHSNASALCDSPRNVPDDVLDRLVANDGMIMATFIPDFVSEEVRRWMLPARELFTKVFGKAERKAIIARHEAEHGQRPRATLSQVADHIEYMSGKVGADRIGIGSDFCGSPILTLGLEDVGCIKNLLVEMVVRGWSEDNIAKLAGLNFIRVFRAVERESQRLASEAETDLVAAQ